MAVQSLLRVQIVRRLLAATGRTARPRANATGPAQICTGMACMQPRPGRGEQIARQQQRSRQSAVDCVHCWIHLPGSERSRTRLNGNYSENGHRDPSRAIADARKSPHHFLKKERDHVSILGSWQSVKASQGTAACAGMGVTAYWVGPAEPATSMNRPLIARSAVLKNAF